MNPKGKPLEPIAFLSYTQFDDQYEEGAITRFCNRLSAAVRFQTGREFLIFRDKKDIRWGQLWQERIKQGLDVSTFLIPILTPSYFQSTQSTGCKEEYDQFIEREKKLGRNDLILPVYYVECDELEEPERLEANPWAKGLKEHQYEDWRPLRRETSPQALGLAFERLAKQIKQALREVLPPPSVAPPRRRETGPPPAGGEALSQASVETPARPTRRQEPKTHTVDAMHRGDFPTITKAIAAAQPGERILVRPGFYQEGLVLDKPLEIIGDGEMAEIVVTATGCNAIRLQCNMAIVRNLTLRQAGGGDWFAVDIAQGRLVLEDCDITSQSLACVAIHGRADPVVRRNRIHDGKNSGVFVYENGLGTIEENDISANALSGVSISGGGNPTLRRNRIHDGKSAGVHVYENGLGTIEENDISANAMVGVAISGGGNPTLRRNRIHDGKSAGVYVYENGLGTIEENDISASALFGVAIKGGGNPTLRRNRIHNNGYEAVRVYDGGSGTFEDNDLRDNARGAWNIASGCQVKRARNQE